MSVAALPVNGVTPPVSTLAVDASQAGSWSIANFPPNTDNIAPIPVLSAASSGSNGPDQTNALARGIKLFVNVTAVAGTSPTLTVTLQGRDQVSGAYYPILVSPAISATGMTVLSVYPGLAAAANSVANDVLPRTWRVITTIGGVSPAFTATIGASLSI